MVLIKVCTCCYVKNRYYVFAGPKMEIFFILFIGQIIIWIAFWKEKRKIFCAILFTYTHTLPNSFSRIIEFIHAKAEEDGEEGRRFIHIQNALASYQWEPLLFFFCFFSFFFFFYFIYNFIPKNSHLCHLFIDFMRLNCFSNSWTVWVRPQFGFRKYWMCSIA